MQKKYIDLTTEEIRKAKEDLLSKKSKADNTLISTLSEPSVECTFKKADESK